MANLTKTVFYYDDGTSTVEEVVVSEVPATPGEEQVATPEEALAEAPAEAPTEPEAA